MNNKAALLLIVVVLTAVLGCARLSELGKETAKTESNRSSSYSLAEKEWKSHGIGNTDITVELPASPVDKTPALPPSYKAVFSSMHISAYDEKDFQSSFTELVPTGARKFQIKELAETNMSAIKKQLPDLAYTIDIKSDTNAKMLGSFTKNGKSYDVKGCCIYKKTNPERVWAVVTIVPKDNADAQNASQRIIGSAVFKNSTETCQ